MIIQFKELSGRISAKCDHKEPSKPMVWLSSESVAVALEKEFIFLRPFYWNATPQIHIVYNVFWPLHVKKTGVLFPWFAN